MVNITAHGFTDEAAHEDLFEISKYIDGLTAFIQNCDTPMTISIQGSWGTGKTSIMQIINNSLEKKGTTKSIWFNTWQFSQFNMDNDLAISLLSCLVNELSLSEAQKEKVSKTTRAIQFAQAAGKLGQELFLSVLDSKVGGRVAENAEKALSSMFGGGNGEVDPATAIKNLKKEFSDCVKETLAGTQKDRVVIFIDDLDRLDPRKAVELLEVLKLFLDCEQCVFVLAIDYDVVCRGVAAKYGEDIGTEKGRSFFDKIIQVPFKMPVAEYNINNYVASCFKSIGIPCPESELDAYVKLIKTSTGTNPRSMKRLFNSYLLLTIVVSSEVLEADKNKRLLFAVLCMQYSFEKTYNYIVGKRATITPHDFELLSSGDCQDINDQLDGITLSEAEAARLQPFMERFCEAIDADGNSKLSNAEIDNLRNVLGISTITSSGEEDVTPRTRQVEVMNSAAELEWEGMSIEDVEALVSKIMAIGSGIRCSYRKTSNSHIQFKTPRGRTFTDIFMRKKGVGIDCVGASKEVFLQPEINAVVEKYKLNILPSSTVPRHWLSFPVKDADSEADYLKVATACFNSFS